MITANLMPVSESVRLPVKKTSRLKAQNIIFADRKAGSDNLTDYPWLQPNCPDDVIRCPRRLPEWLIRHQSLKTSKYELF